MNTVDSASRHISVWDLWTAIIANKALILSSGAIFGFIALVWALLEKPVYRVEATLIAQTSSSNMLGASGAGSALGGLASLAGFSTFNDDPLRQETLATLQSKSFTESFIAENNLLPILYAAKWDAKNGRWKDPQDPPTLWKASIIFDKSIRTVRLDKESGLVILIIDWYDKNLAASWCSKLIEKTNLVMSTRSLERARRNAAYLENQLGQTSLVGVREALFRLLEAEQKSIMLSQNAHDFALRIIDPPVLPDTSWRPRKALMVIAGVSFGLLGGCFFVFLRLIARLTRPVS